MGFFEELAGDRLENLEKKKPVTIDFEPRGMMAEVISEAQDNRATKGQNEPQKKRGRPLLGGFIEGEVNEGMGILKPMPEELKVKGAPNLTKKALNWLGNLKFGVADETGADDYWTKERLDKIPKTIPGKNLLPSAERAEKAITEGMKGSLMGLATGSGGGPDPNYQPEGMAEELLYSGAELGMDTPLMPGMGAAPKMAQKALGGIAPKLGKIGGKAANAFGKVFNLVTPMGAVFGTLDGAKKWYRDYYEKGAVADWDDFVERIKGASAEFAKGYGIGTVTGFVKQPTRRAVYKVLQKAGVAPKASEWFSNASTLPAEVAAMVTTGAAIEGKMPTSRDFINASLLMLGMKGADRAMANSSEAKQNRKALEKIHAQTGEDPYDIARMLSERRYAIDPKTGEQIDISTPEGLKKSIEIMRPTWEVEDIRADLKATGMNDAQIEEYLANRDNTVVPGKVVKPPVPGIPERQIPEGPVETEKTSLPRATIIGEEAETRVMKDLPFKDEMEMGQFNELLRKPAFQWTAEDKAFYGRMLDSRDSVEIERAQAGGDPTVVSFGQKPTDMNSFLESTKRRFDEGMGFTFGNSIQDIRDNPYFQKWFKDSQTTNRKGDPLVLYHGTKTPEDFDAFSMDKISIGSGDKGFYGAGLYFTNDPNYADMYAGSFGNTAPVNSRVVPTHVAMKNPFVMRSNSDMARLAGVDPEAFSKKIQEKGYDGIISEFTERSYKDGGVAEFVVFDPKQVKSIFNKGTYDDSPRIGMGIEDVSDYSLGSKPEKTIKAYKLFRTRKDKPGELFPLFIGKGKSVPVGEWIDAEHIPTKGFAQRPGWHVGSKPQADHLLRKDGTMAEDRVWAEVEIPADVDWQAIADKSPSKDIPGEVPKGGHYRFKRPFNQGGEWMIGGSMKVNKILSKTDVEDILSGKMGMSVESVDKYLDDLLKSSGRHFVRYAGPGHTETDISAHGTGKPGQENTIKANYKYDADPSKSAWADRLYAYGMWEPAKGQRTRTPYKDKPEYGLKETAYLLSSKNVLEQGSKEWIDLVKEAKEKVLGDKVYGENDQMAVLQMTYRLAQDKGYDFVDMGEHGALILKSGIPSREVAFSLITDMIKQTQAYEGATFSIAKGKNMDGEKLFSVAIGEIDPDTGKMKALSKDYDTLNIPEKDIKEFTIKYAKYLANENFGIGTWLDKESGKTVLDVVALVPDKAMAIAMGKRFDQKAIWDLYNREEIRTGGTGTGEAAPITGEVTGEVPSMGMGVKDISKKPIKISKEGLDTGEEKGIIFIGADMVGVDMEGNRANMGVTWIDENMGFAMGKGAATRLHNKAKESYKTIVIVAYKDVHGSMRDNPLFRKAVERELRDSYGDEYTDSLLKAADAKYDAQVRSKWKKPKAGDGPHMASVIAVGMQDKAKLLPGKKKVSMEQVAKKIAVDGWQDMAGNIVGIARYGGEWADYPEHDVYEAGIKFKSYYRLPEPVDFESFVKHTDVEGHRKDQPWFSLRNINMWMNKRDSRFIPEIIAAAHGDMSRLADLTDGLGRAPEINKVTTYYRGGSPSDMPKGSALDVYKYETDELGNSLNLKVPKNDLSKYNARDLQWVTDKKTDAREYGSVSKVEVGEHNVLLTDNYGGKLIHVPRKIPTAGLVHSGIGYEEMMRHLNSRETRGEQRAASSFLEFFKPGATLPNENEFMYARQKAQGMIALGDYHAEKFTKKYEYLTNDQRAVIWKYLNGDIEITDLSQDLQGPAREMRKLDNDLGKMLVDSGFISQETYDANEGKHIKYIYNTILQNEGLIGVGGAKINRNIVKSRLEVDDQVREKWGLIQDPVQALAISTMEVYKNVGMQKFFSEIGAQPFIRKLGDKSWEVVGIDGSSLGTFNKYDDAMAAKQQGRFANPWLWAPSVMEVQGKRMGINRIDREIDKLRNVPEDQRNATQKAYLRDLIEARHQSQDLMEKPLKNFKQLNGAGYGDLDGAYVHETIWNDLQPIYGSMTDPLAKSKFMSTLNGINALWKTKTVALNIPTATRNVISNVLQLNLSGVPLLHIPVRLREAAKAMRSKDANWKAALEQGMFKGNFSSAELEEIIGLSQNVTGLDGILRMARNLGKYYGKIDDVTKMIKFLEERKKGSSVEESVRLANKWGMDYSFVNPWIKKLRSNPLGSPFITYSYKALPLIVEAAKTRPLTLLKWMALPALISAMSQQDMTEEDAQEFRRSLPDYVKNGQVIMFPGSNGNMQALDVSYMVPWGNLYQIASNAAKGEIGQAFNDLGVGQSLIPSVLFALRTGKDLFTGKPIINPLNKGDEIAEAWDVAKYVYDVAMPPMLAMGTRSGAAMKIYEHARYGETNKGLMTEWYNAYPRMAGVNIYPVDPDGGRRSRYHDVSQAKRQLMSIMRDHQSSDEDKEAAREAFQDLLERTQEEE